MINTYICDDTSGNWNKLTYTGSAGINTWDPCQIDWTGISITPCAPCTLPGAAIGAPGVMPAYDYTVFDGNGTWSPTVTPKQLTKPQGVRPDVLMGFFSKYVHALLFVSDIGTYVIPFMERVGLIWLEEDHGWTAYDKDEFYKFIDDPDATLFTGTVLNKREIQRRMSKAEE